MIPILLSGEISTMLYKHTKHNHIYTSCNNLSNTWISLPFGNSITILKTTKTHYTITGITHQTTLAWLSTDSQMLITCMKILVGSQNMCNFWSWFDMNNASRETQSQYTSLKVTYVLPYISKSSKRGGVGGGGVTMKLRDSKSLDMYNSTKQFWIFVTSVHGSSIFLLDKVIIKLI